MKFTSEQYLEAAKIVASCKESRLNIVLDILRKGGFDISSDAIMNAIEENVSNGHSADEIKKFNRMKRYDKRWLKTDDPIILALRNAYLDGVKISTIASAAGITRTALYEYMVGRRQYSPWIAERFISAFSSLNIHYPPTPSDPSELPD